MSNKWRLWLIGIAIVFDALVLQWTGRYVELDKATTFILSLLCFSTLFKALESFYLVAKTKKWRHGSFGIFALDGMVTLLLFVILTDETASISREIWVPVCLIGFIAFFVLVGVTHRLEKELGNSL